MKKLMFLCGVLSIAYGDVSCMFRHSLRGTPQTRREQAAVKKLMRECGADAFNLMSARLKRYSKEVLVSVIELGREHGLDIPRLSRLDRRRKKTMVCWFVKNMPDFPEGFLDAPAPVVAEVDDPAPAFAGFDDKDLSFDDENPILDGGDPILNCWGPMRIFNFTSRFV
ncbi:MAG: hypothetical protein LBJ96_01030 [Holosporaceae bacterium]|nr:hypothetical protein [Holosporaceae bacterium]